ncbi:MAG TPA: molybdenum cofactor biosynthesis protein MoaE [Xanthomonadales bacterium]|nr:molybdenum cofactor biosynthesis protein MoaE [Xanthomonadales bacterium]
MNRFEISSEAIDLEQFRASLVDETCGAFVTFEGWVRNHNDGRAVLRLAYEVYEPLAVKEGLAILEEAMKKFEITQVHAVHRQGELAMSEPAVVVGVASAHRDAAFKACRYVIDEVKARLPIWKKEYYADGDTEWVNCQHSVHAVKDNSTATKQTGNKQT